MLAGAAGTESPSWSGAPAAGWTLARRPFFGGGVGGEGLSVGVHIWEPLAHSCPLCMFADGSGRDRAEGLAPHRRTEIQTERETARPEGGKGPGKRHPTLFPLRRRTSGHSVLLTLLVLLQTGGGPKLERQ